MSRKLTQAFENFDFFSKIQERKKFNFKNASDFFQIFWRHFRGSNYDFSSIKWL